MTLGMPLLKTTSRLHSEGFGISWASLTLDQGLANFFCKGPDSNIFGFAGHMVRLAITQLCLCCRKQLEPRCKQRECLCPNKTLFAKAGGRLDFALGYNLWFFSLVHLRFLGARETETCHSLAGKAGMKPPYYRVV